VINPPIISVSGNTYCDELDEILASPLIKTATRLEKRQRESSWASRFLVNP
jgi:hypothetical protein